MGAAVVAAICGTPLAVLPAVAGPVLMLSDLHLPADGGRVLRSLQGALAAAVSMRATVFVLGDLFETYITPRQVAVAGWRDAAAAFAAAAARGVAVHLLRGNRDFLLGAEFAAAGRLQLAAGGLRLRLLGRETVLLHGDELCTNDLPYQRAKRWLRHPCTQWLARRLPIAVALRVAARARARSMKVVQQGDQSRFLPPQAVVENVFTDGVTQLVFGHVHRLAHGRLRGGEYWVLPAFDATATGLVADAEGWRPVAFAADGGVTALPVPDRFPFPAVPMPGAATGSDPAA